MPEITMPKMSDTMEEGKVVRWLKQSGDQVTAGEPIAEIETDKANVEMEAFDTGVLGEILVKEGETVAVGAPIGTIESPGTAAAPKAPPKEAPKPEVAAPPPTVEAPPPTQAKAEEPPAEVPVTAAAPPEAPQPATAPEAEERIKASPLARRMAEENGIDLTTIQGTGPDGRIVEVDIENQLKKAAPKAPEASAPATPAPPVATKPAAPVIGAPAEEVELSKMRKVIAHRMTQSKQTIPHFYVTTEIDMDWAARVRDELNSMEGNPPKISFTDIIIKAVALTLRDFPTANASYSDDKLLMHKDINVGMAVALEDGLIVPVIRNADGKSLQELATMTRELAERARSGSLRTSEYTGATFTVTNMGMYEVESFASIINPPESASLAIGAIVDKAVVIEGQVAISKRMKVTLSVDHRALDGAVAAKFLLEFKKKLESPIGLL